MAEKIKKVITILTNAKQDVANELQGTEFENINLRVKHSIEQMVNLMGHYGNLEVSHTVSQPQKLEPITEFMGEKIEGAKKVQSEDIEPGLDAKQLFKNKVQALYDSFLEREDDELLTSNTIAEDQLALRGVAKKAGVLDYGIRDLTIQFIQEIKDGIKAKNDANNLSENMKAFDAAVAAGDAAAKSKKWDDAKKHYEDAATYFPENEYPKTRLAAIAKNIKD